nr:CihA [Streptomyces sp.]
MAKIVKRFRAEKTLKSATWNIWYS